MPKGIKIKWDKEQLKKLYWDKGLFQYEIAERLKVTRGAVGAAMIKLRIPRRRKGEALHLAYATGRAQAPKRKGAESPHWRGGRRLVKGYVYIYNPSHPKATKQGLIAEHILIWEKTNKIPLPKGYIIHHLNGIRTDNHPKNLIAMPRKGHNRYLVLKAVQKRLRELEGRLAQKELF